jgi:hypothetical protein
VAATKKIARRRRGFFNIAAMVAHNDDEELGMRNEEFPPLLP